MKRNIFTVLLVTASFSITFTSCSTSKRVDKGIKKYYANTIPEKVKNNDYINFTVENTLPGNEISQTRKTKNKLIPALFYWKWRTENTSTINNMMPVPYFTSSFITAANSRKLKDKLNGGTVTLTIRENPANFVYVIDGWMVFLLLAYVGGEKVAIEPMASNFSVNYSISYPSGETKKGVLTTANINRDKAPRYFQNVKGFTREYLASCDNNIKVMAKDLVTDLLAQISEIE
jgi:hypothetical protein